MIHDIVTTSPSDNEPQGTMSFITNIDLGAPLDIPAIEIAVADSRESYLASLATEFTVSDTPADSGQFPASPAGGSDVSSAEPEVNVPTETLAAVEANINFAPETTEPAVLQSLETDHPAGESPAPETVGSAEAEEEEDKVEPEEERPSETMDVDGEDEEGED